MAVYDRPLKIYDRRLSRGTGVCEICGLKRGGPNGKNHTKCSEIRKQGGFAEGRDPRRESTDDQLSPDADENP
jgi:hypothetical protein